MNVVSKLRNSNLFYQLMRYFLAPLKEINIIGFMIKERKLTTIKALTNKLTTDPTKSSVETGTLTGTKASGNTKSTNRVMPMIISIDMHTAPKNKETTNKDTNNMRETNSSMTSSKGDTVSQQSLK